MGLSARLRAAERAASEAALRRDAERLAAKCGEPAEVLLAAIKENIRLITADLGPCPDKNRLADWLAERLGTDRAEALAGLERTAAELRGQSGAS